MPNPSLGRSAGNALPIPRATAVSQPFAWACPIPGSPAHFVTDTDLSQFVARFPLAIFLVGPQAQILYSNAYADEMLARRGIVQSERGKLVLNAPQARRLRRLLAAAVDEIGDGPANVSIALTAPDGSFWIAQIRARPYGGVQDAGTVALLLREAVLDLDTAAALVSDFFTLTPAERRALPALLRLRHLGEVAHSCGVAETTMRTHLQNIFGKTVTNGRNELIKLVARFAHAACL